MTARKRGAAPDITREAAAAKTAMHDLGMGQGNRNTPTWDQAEVVAEAALAAAPATQVRRPWRSTVRTLLQVALGLAPMLPAIVHASGVDDTAAPVAGALAISAAATRVMALPDVEAFLQRFVPWLAASPRPATP